MYFLFKWQIGGDCISQRYSGKQHPWMDKDWLYNEYVVKDRRSQEIADEYGCKQNTIQCWLRHHNIKKEITTHYRRCDKIYQQYDYLYKSYVQQQMSVAAIAQANNVSDDTIRYHLRLCGIQLRESNSMALFTTEQLAQIRKLYIDDRLSAVKIGAMFNTDGATIRRYLTKAGVQTRNRSQAQFAIQARTQPDLLLNQTALYDLHWRQKLSCKEIGQRLHIEPGTVRRWMHKNGLRTRTNAESKIGLMTGESHPNWQGGRTALNALLREYFSTNQVKNILKRDSYTCQMCGARHVELHVHHIIHFADIVEQICSEHPEYHADIPSERLQLYQIITTDRRFLDPTNLITLCQKCHLYKVHHYIQKSDNQQPSL